MPKTRKTSVEITEKMKNACMKKRYVRYEEGAQLYAMKLHTFRNLSKSAKATREFKGITLVNLDEVNAYIEKSRME